MTYQYYDPARAGREIYIAKNGLKLERKWQYQTRDEWDFLYRLAKDSGVSLGQMQMDLAYEHSNRIRANLRKRIYEIS